MPDALPAPVAPPRVYRAALADERRRSIMRAVALWVGFHVLMGVVIAREAALQRAAPIPPAPDPDTAVWFSIRHLQLGVRAFETLGSSLLDSMGWQIGGLILFAAALMVLLTNRLRIVALVVPVPLFLGAAAAQCIAYNVHHPYQAELNPFATLLLMGACLHATRRFAPRNSTWRDLRTLTRDLWAEARRNPLLLVFGPVFSKEVRVSGRHVSTYWIRAIYPLGLLSLVTLVFYAVSFEGRSAGGIASVERLQEVAPVLALNIAWAQFLLLLLLAATLTSSAICEERRTRTLAALMTTPLNATQIVVGKLAGRFLPLLIIGLICIPFLLGVRTFGGLDPEVIIAMVGITLTSALLMASLGVLASVWCRRAASAAALAIALYLLIAIGPIIAAALLFASSPTPPATLFSISAPASLMLLTVQLTGGGGIPLAIREIWTVNCLVNIAYSGAAIAVAAVSLRGVMLSERALEAPRRKLKRRAGRARATSAPAPDSSADAPPTAPPDTPPELHEVFVDRARDPGDNPVLWRELRQPAVGSRKTKIVIAGLVGALLLWVYSEAPPTDAPPHVAAVAIGLVLLTIQAAVVSTTSVTNEKDGSTWLTLLSTALTPRQILFPKLVGAVRKLWFFAALIGAELAIGVLAGRVHPVLFLHLGMLIIGTGAFLGGTGIFLSLWCRRGTTASLLNMLLAGALWLGIPFFGTMLSEFVLRPLMGRANDIEEAIYLINPIVLGISSALGSVEKNTPWTADLPSSSGMALVPFTTIVFAVCTTQILLGVGAVYLGCSRFNRLSGRTS